MFSVTKADGSRQPFLKEKIIRTCLRMSSSQEQAESIADRIERKIYEGIPSKKILQMIFSYMKAYKPEIRYLIDLREAISLLRPKPDFEQFVFLLLKEYGYEVSPPQIVKGICVDHEIDAIAKKDGDVLMVEVEHHINHHTFTGVSSLLEAQATFEDVGEAFDVGLSHINFNKILMVCNTKFSEHAIKYGNCKKINLIGWKYTQERGLERLIEEKKLYPITFLKGLDEKTEEKLADAGIVLLRQLVEQDLLNLPEKTGIQRKKLESLIQIAREIL